MKPIPKWGTQQKREHLSEEVPNLETIIEPVNAAEAKAIVLQVGPLNADIQWVSNM